MIRTTEEAVLWCQKMEATVSFVGRYESRLSADKQPWVHISLGNQRGFPSGKNLLEAVQGQFNCLLESHEEIEAWRREFLGIEEPVPV